jgi:hypothetical protein
MRAISDVAGGKRWPQILEVFKWQVRVTSCSGSLTGLLCKADAELNAPSFIIRS